MAGTSGAKGGGLFSKFTGIFSVGGGKAAVGLSIGSSSVKLVELKKVGSGWKLTKFQMAPIPEDAMVNREIINPVAVATSIKAIVDRAKPSSKNVCTCVGGPGVIVRRMNVEVATQKELEQAVFFEAEQYLPFDPAEVSMDFFTISKGKDGKHDVLFVAAKNLVLDGYVDAIAQSGLKPNIVDLEYFALQNAFEMNLDIPPGQAVAIIDIGAVAMRVVVLHDGVPVYTKDTALGGRALTSEIQKQMGLSFDDAESLKISTAGGVAQEALELIASFSENYGLEAKRTLDFYSASSSGAPVGSIFITGGGSLIQGLERIIQDKTGIPTQYLNLFTRVSFDEKQFTPEMIQAIAPIAAVPIGLALRGTLG